MTDEEPKSDVEKVTDEATYLRKGKRVACEFFRAKPLGDFSLSGMQMKTTGYFVRVTGVIQRISAEGSRERPVNIKVELLVETEEPQCPPEEESLIATVVLLDPSTVKEFLS